MFKMVQFFAVMHGLLNVYGGAEGGGGGGSEFGLATAHIISVLYGISEKYDISE